MSDGFRKRLEAVEAAVDGAPSPALSPIDELREMDRRTREHGRRQQAAMRAPDPCMGLCDVDLHEPQGADDVAIFDEVDRGPEEIDAAVEPTPGESDAILGLELDEQNGLDDVIDL